MGKIIIQLIQNHPLGNSLAIDICLDIQEETSMTVMTDSSTDSDSDAVPLLVNMSAM